MIRLFGSKIYVSIFTLMLLAIITLSADAPFFYIALFGALFHELAHIVSMKMFGANIIRISVYPFGADIKADTSRLTYKNEIFVFLSGPSVSLLSAVVAFILYKSLGTVYILAFSLSNFLFFAVNILPVKGLDGGRALYCLLHERYDITKAQRIFDILSSIAFGLLCAFAFFLLFVTGYNLSLVFVCTYLFLSEYIRQRAVL